MNYTRMVLAASLVAVLGACGGGGGGNQSSPSTSPGPIAGGPSQEPPNPDVPTVPVPEAIPSSAQPKFACSTMAGTSFPATDIGLPTTGVNITASTLVAATANLPEYCRIAGDILPVDSTAPSIKFAVNLPTDWSLKAIQAGGGGQNGSIPGLTSTSGGGAPGTPSPLLRGYAIFGSDSGHQGNAQDWALNQEALTNFGHAQMKKTRDAVVAVTKKMYGYGPQKVYYVGSSQGGREGMEVVQRYPKDYDGVVSSVPLNYFTGLLLNPTQFAQLQLTPEAWIPGAKAAVIAAEVQRQCDDLDGLPDGVINNYEACAARFDSANVVNAFGAIRCAGGGDAGNSCLSDAQLLTLSKFHTKTNHGFDYLAGSGASYSVTSFPGWGLGLEGANAWLLTGGSAPPMSNFGGGIGGTFMKFVIGGSANFDLTTLDLRQSLYQDRVKNLANILDASNPDLSPFLARGGKLIVRSNASDYISNPRAQQAWYKSVVAKMGQGSVDSFMRFYVAPQSSHGNTGTNYKTNESLPNSVDLTQSIIDWVEAGVVPSDQLVMTRNQNTAPFTVLSSKPMCRYPKYPRFNGTGLPSDSASYTCAAPF